MFDALVVDSRAISALDAALIDEEWFADFALPANAEGLRRITLGRNVYILSNEADAGSGLLVVNVGREGVFRGQGPRRPRFERILRVALRHFDRNITLPVQWQPYHDGSRMSVYAEPQGKQAWTRIYFDQAANKRLDIYAYTATDGPKSLNDVDPDKALLDEAVDRLEEAIYYDQPPAPTVGNFGILLNERLGAQIGGAVSLEEWLQHRLNPQQMNFVARAHDRPIRLRGAAGTGKTQAMVVKLLKDMLEDADAANLKTFAFLTHSSALAHEVVRGMLYALDPGERWRTLRTSDGRAKLWIGTLYELAQEKLEYGRKGLIPLSLDGREGQEYQRILINDALAKVTGDARIMYGVLGADETFAARLSSLADRSVLIEELMNEFACVLDAENVRKGGKEAEAYLTGSRERWQMHLATKEQRQAILEVHDAYRMLLKNQRLLSMDQMVADFGRYLFTHEWEQLRERDGFDVIFVDEYHYFNRVESMTLQSLFRSRARVQGRWPLLMAYDLKQATSDASLGGGVERFRNPGVGESIEVQLVENYRSTPQITAFLQDLDAAFPVMDLEGEFSTHIAPSRQADGEKPVIQTYDTSTQLVDRVFDEAISVARQIGGRRVAVLCLNDELFDTYRKAGRLAGKFVAVTSREELRELQYAKTRCVFSMPEYVAGLQFDVVLLIHADQTDLSNEYLSQGARRRYVSRVYLGASRAQTRLVIATSRERGGASEVLNGPLHNQSLLDAS